MSNLENAYERFQAAVGETEGTGEWFQITQADIDTFADVTHDHQFIHVDPEMSAQLSPWKVPIAHGFLTLSMLTHLMGSVPQDKSRVQGVVMGINYGFDKVRFLNPVKVEQQIRAKSVLAGVELKQPNALNVTRTITVEIDGEDRPAVVCDWITRLVYG